MKSYKIGAFFVFGVVWSGSVVQGWSFFVFWFGLGFSVELRSRVMSCRVSRKSSWSKMATSTLPFLGSFVNTSKLGTNTI